MKPIYHPHNIFIFAKRFLTSATKSLFERVSTYRGYLLRALLVGLAISVAVTTLAWLGQFKPY